MSFQFIRVSDGTGSGVTSVVVPRSFVTGTPPARDVPDLNNEVAAALGGRMNHSVIAFKGKVQDYANAR